MRTTGSSVQQHAYNSSKSTHQGRLGDVLGKGGRYGREASPNASPRQDVAQQGAVRHAHVCRLLENDRCRLQRGVHMDSTEEDCVWTMPAHTHMRSHIDIWTDMDWRGRHYACQQSKGITQRRLDRQRR